MDDTRAEQEAVRRAWLRFSAHAKHGVLPEAHNPERDPAEEPEPEECGRCLRAKQLLTEPGWDGDVFQAGWEVACEVGRPLLEEWSGATAVLAELLKAMRKERLRVIAP